MSGHLRCPSPEQNILCSTEKTLVRPGQTARGGEGFCLSLRRDRISRTRPGVLRALIELVEPQDQHDLVARCPYLGRCIRHG